MYNYQGIFFRGNLKAEGNLKHVTPPYRVFCLFIIAFLLFSTSEIFAQGVGVNSSGNPPDPSAIFDASATDKGMLIPRLTTSQRTTISTPAIGLMVYDTSTNSFWYYNGTAWTEIGGANAGDITDVTAGNGLTGGGTSGNATLDVGAGAGITVNANDVSLSNSGVTPGSYTSSNITVDTYGRVTAAANGSSGGCNMKSIFSGLDHDAPYTTDFNDNTRAKFALFDAYCNITVNQISFYVNGVTTNGSYKIAVYSEDGQTKIIDVTGTSVTASSTNSVAVSSVTLPAGRYYLGMLSVGTTDFGSRQAPFRNSDLIYPPGKAKLSGWLTVSPNTFPATITPSSLNHDAPICFRLDN